MQLDRLAGNETALAPLKAALAAGALPHAVLLCAPNGAGRNFCARCLAADYLFPEGGPGAEAVLRGQSSEVLTVAGQGKSGQIPVDRIRAVRTDVFRSALSAAGRAVHIRDAHLMAAPAANALLKVLEEPPADVLFILTTHSPAALPATIVSRCALYTLVPAGGAACVALLEAALPAGADKTLPALLCAVYDGRAGLGLRALADPARLATLQDALVAAKAAAARDSYGLLALFSGYEGRAEGDRERRDELLADLADVLSAAMRGWGPLRGLAGGFGAECAKTPDTRRPENADRRKAEAGCDGVSAPGLPVLPAAAAALLLPPVQNARTALRGNAAPKITFAALAVQLARAGLA